MYDLYSSCDLDETLINIYLLTRERGETDRRTDGQTDGHTSGGTWKGTSSSRDIPVGLCAISTQWFYGPEKSVFKNV